LLRAPKRPALAGAGFHSRRIRGRRLQSFPTACLQDPLSEDFGGTRPTPGVRGAGRERQLLLTAEVQSSREWQPSEARRSGAEDRRSIGRDLAISSRVAYSASS
jgi:hypothetical protein